MTELGGSWWRSMDPASQIAVDAELGDRVLSLAPHLSWLKHDLAHQLIRSPGVASSTLPPNVCVASLTAWIGSFSNQRWDSTNTFAPTSRASAPASKGVM